MEGVWNLDGPYKARKKKNRVKKEIISVLSNGLAHSDHNGNQSRYLELLGRVLIQSLRHKQ